MCVGVEVTRSGLVMVILCVIVTGLRNAQIAAETLFLSMAVTSYNLTETIYAFFVSTMDFIVHSILDCVSHTHKLVYASHWVSESGFFLSSP